MFYRFTRSSHRSSVRSSETAIAVVGSNTFSSVPSPVDGPGYPIEGPSAAIGVVEGIVSDVECQIDVVPSEGTCAVLPPASGLPTTNGPAEASVARRLVSNSRLALRLTFVTLVTATTVGLVLTGMNVATAAGLLLIGGLVAVEVLRKTERI